MNFFGLRSSRGGESALARALTMLIAAIVVAPRSMSASSSPHRAAAEVPAGPTVATTNGEKEGVILGALTEPWEAMAAPAVAPNPDVANGPSHASMAVNTEGPDHFAKSHV